MLVAVLSGYLIGLFAPIGARLLKSAAGPFLAALPAFLFAYFLQFVPEAAEGRPWRFGFAWGSPGGIEAVFWIDALALFYALLITALTGLATIASAGLMLSDQARGRLLLALMSLMSSSLGFVLAQTPALMMGFAVAATLSVFLLLTAERGAAERAARIPVLMALITGDLFLVAALAGLFPGGEGAALSDLLTRHTPREPAIVAAGVLLVTAGLARFCLLPAELRARRHALMNAPAALLAYGAAYLPLTLYIVLRFLPMLGAGAEYRFVLGLVGASLLVAGGFTALRARVFRTLLASVTALMMGMAFIQLATFDAQGVAVAMLVVLTHAFGLGALLLAVQMAVGGSASIELAALRSHMRSQPAALVLLVLGSIAFAGLVPSTGLLLLSKSLEAGLGVMPNPAEIAFMTLGHALLIAALFKIVRGVMIVPAERAVLPRALSVSAAVAGLLLILGLLSLGWNPAVIERLFIDPVTYRLAPVSPIGPFWPRGLAILLAATALICAGLLVWFSASIARLLDWLGGAFPARPDRFWGASLAFLDRLARLGARGVGRLGYARGPVAATFLLCCALIWLCLVSLGELPGWPAGGVVPMGALAAIAALTACLTLAQDHCESALPLLSICGVVTALLVLSSGLVDLAYLMVLIVVLETAIFLVAGPRILPDETHRAASLGRAARAALALVVGASAALASLFVPAATERAASWTSLDQFQLWAAVVVMLLVLGVIITDLNHQRMRGAS